jgi:hypothetical protein
MPSSREAPPCVEWDQSGNSHPFERPGTKAGEVDTHGTFAVRREADQLKRHKDQFEEFVMKYAEPEECVPSLSEPGIRMLDVGQLTGATVELDHIDSPTNSIDAPDHDSARFAPSPAAEASLSEHRGKSPEAASGILGLRDPSLLESPFADSDAGDVVDGDSAFEKLLGPGDSRKQPGDIVQLDMSLFNSAVDSATPRFSVDRIAQSQPDFVPVCFLFLTGLCLRHSSAFVHAWKCVSGICSVAVLLLQDLAFFVPFLIRRPFALYANI